MTTPADFYGVPLVSITTQVDSITISHSSAAALSKKGITSYPSLETTGASPTADVITVYDVTTSTALVLNTDYTLTASGSSPETQTYSVTRINASSASADGDTCHVTYRFGTVPDTSYNAGEFQGEAGAAPAGTAFQASSQPTSGSTVAGIGEQAAGGSLTDPANTVKGGPETGSPGSEYGVTPTHPSTFGYNALGSPDTEAVYGGALPENFVPTDTSFTTTVDTAVAGGSNLVPAMYPSPPGYRAPSAGVAAGTKDTTLTDILGNQANATAASPPSGYAATQIDTSYIGSPAAPTALVSQTDAFAADQAGMPDYLSQSGIIPASIVVTNTTTSTLMVLTTDYTVTTAGNGPTLNAYITPVAGTNFANGNSVSVTYNWGDPTYWDSNAPASVPAAPTMNSVTAVNRGVNVNWSAPATNVYVQYYLLHASDLGTMYVPYTGQPVNYGQTSPSGGATYGQPTYQSDVLNLVAAALAVPATPTSATATTGGTVLAGTYTMVTTYTNANGETLASATHTQVTTGSTSTLTVNSPATETGATHWYAYVSQVGGTTLTRQQAAGSPTLIGTNLTLTAPPTSTGANPPALNTTVPTTSKAGVLTPPAQVIVKDLTTAGAEGDPLQPDGFVLEYGYDYTITVVGAGPWTQYQVNLVASSVNAAAGDQIEIDYWYGADPSSVSAVFTQGLVQNTPVIYKPDGTTPYNQGYRFRVAACNQLGVGPWSAWSSYAVPLNYNEPQSNASITVGTGSLDPANTINPIYTPAGTVKSGTGLGG
jgi:hypothetical protein